MAFVWASRQLTVGKDGKPLETERFSHRLETDLSVIKVSRARKNNKSARYDIGVRLL